MKSKILISMLAGAALLVPSCTPDEYDLGSKGVESAQLAEGLAFDVSIDQTTNKVTYSTLPSIGTDKTVCWDFSNVGGGYVQQREGSFSVPFAGKYYAFFGVMTQGGYVQSDTIWLDFQNTNGALLTDPMWSKLAGGSGKSKTWVMDLDADGVSKYWPSMLGYYGVDDNYNNVNGGFSALGDGFDSWNWFPDWAGNTWLTGDVLKDWGTMTFDLINGANVTVNDVDNGNSKGTFIIDTDKHTITLTNAKILHLSNFDGVSTNWNAELKILSLTDHTLQIAVLRDNSDEGPCLLGFSYISEEAYNNPDLLPKEDNGNSGSPAAAPVSPSLPSDLNTAITVPTSKSQTYIISEESPYDWLWWNGANSTWETNGFKSSAPPFYPSWAPTMTGFDSFALTLESTSDNGGEYTFVDFDENETTGKYTISDSKIVFDKELSLAKASNDLRTVNFTGTEFYVLGIDTDEGTLQIGLPDTKDAETGITNQYSVLNLVLKPAGAVVAGPTKIAVDNSLIKYGDLEGNSNLRIELYNEYGSGTFANPPFNTSKVKFKQKLSVTFTISGLGTLSNGCVGAIGCSIDWSFNGSDGGTDITHQNANITGDGTYTVSITNNTGASIKIDKLNVFVIDILGVGANLSDDKDKYVDNSTSYFLTAGDSGSCENITLTVDSFEVE